MKKETFLQKTLVLILVMIFWSVSAFGAVAGDVDDSNAIDLKDAIISLQVSADAPPSSPTIQKNEAANEN